MMFCCGRRDALFPVASTEKAFTKMRRVWESQNAGAKLETRLYDAPHEFNAPMPDKASERLAHSGTFDPIGKLGQGTRPTTPDSIL